MSERKTKTVKVVGQEQYESGLFYFGDDWKDGSLDEVIASLAAIREMVPPEYRAAARCEIVSQSGYEGSHYASISVFYVRPETDEEMADREAKERLRAADKESQERAAYELLRKKFG